ncbi:P-loop containing nucleoside triphosphate hydrolase protein [Sistotremastrum niveocremeum HHB9708]|uniref:p-loop containing nucleoside triphosphate hydrolase protein n=1 Tax=Sistotremastrum niveocremeum HHB9708 TaxID=1314777 RepID=A0A164Q8N8_9AGAM|nr:P-loop containing nucleoside triphosphate hydrolase protein [Sistotremastrum niveocremeum HHB9708]
MRLGGLAKVEFSLPRLSVTPRYDWRNRAQSRAEFRKSLVPQKNTKKAPALGGQRDSGVTPDTAYSAQLEIYKKRYLPLLAAEKAESDAVIKRRLQSWPLSKLISNGYCITGLKAFWLDKTNLGKPTGQFWFGPGHKLPTNQFNVGHQVYITRNGPLEPDASNLIFGPVIESSDTYIRVALENRVSLQGVWRLDLGSSDIADERMRNAIDCLAYNPIVQESLSTLEQDNVIQGTHLRDVLLRTFEDSPDQSETSPSETDALEPSSMPRPSVPGIFSEDMRLHSWCMRYRRINPIRIDGDPLLPGLNAIQIQAIALMLGERISLVQGPPGTGKTRTIIEAVRLLKAHFEVPHPILVCTYTNVAVDNLVEGMIAPNIATSSSGLKSYVPPALKPLRVSFSAGVKASLQPYTLDAKVEVHPMKSELEQMVVRLDDCLSRLATVRDKIEKARAEAAKSAGEKAKLGGKLCSSLLNEQSVKRSIYFGLLRQMTYDICMTSDVICTTCITSASFALKVMDFPAVFLDEASMSTEPASLIPIMKGSKQISLIGDHKQLPPVIVSDEAKKGGLGVSLFERLTNEGTVPSIMLDKQYRMHPSISSFPSSEFYNFELQDGTVDPSTGAVLPSLHPPNSRHLVVDPSTGNRPSVIFLDHAFPEQAKDRSRVNLREGHLVQQIVEDLLSSNPTLKGMDIGVIAPYVAQVALLRNLMLDLDFRGRLSELVGPDRAADVLDIEVKTVDGFEGREKEIIIFSTVRNNSKGHIGFLADRRRMNVGLTRAKRGLFILGNVQTLRAAKAFRENIDGAGVQANVVMKEGVLSWKRYIQWLEQNQLVLLQSHAGHKAKSIYV